MWGKVQLHSFICGCLAVTIPFVKRLFFPHRQGNSHPCQKLVEHRPQNIGVYFWSLNTIPLNVHVCYLYLYLSVLMTVPHCLDYCCSVVSCEIGNWVLQACSFQYCVGYSSCLEIPYESQNWLVNFYKEATQDSKRYCTESVD